MSVEQFVADDVLGTVTELLEPLVGDPDVLGHWITRDTAFHEDLQLESIDLVTFASILAEHYGADVDLADFLSQKDLDEVIELRVGDIVDFVSARLADRR
jgi:acyl carrier protein